MPKVQAAGGGGMGRGRRGRMVAASALAEINVVPLVDVMLVLLIIFMVAAPMMTQGMQVNLPEARKSTNLAVQPIYVTVPVTFARERRVQIGEDTIGIDALPERVRQALLERTEKSLFVRADGAVAYKDIVFVFDKLKTAGIEKVGLITVPVGSR